MTPLRVWEQLCLLTISKTVNLALRLDTVSDAEITDAGSLDYLTPGEGGYSRSLLGIIIISEIHLFFPQHVLGALPAGGAPTIWGE